MLIRNDCPNFHWTGYDSIVCPTTGAVEPTDAFFDMIGGAQHLRDWFHGPLTITSCARSPLHNALLGVPRDVRAGWLQDYRQEGYDIDLLREMILGAFGDHMGAEDSKHLLFQGDGHCAMDITAGLSPHLSPRVPLYLRLEALARRAIQKEGFLGVGVYKTWLHLDKARTELTIWDERPEMSDEWQRFKEAA